MIFNEDVKTLAIFAILLSFVSTIIIIYLCVCSIADIINCQLYDRIKWRLDGVHSSQPLVFLSPYLV